MGRDRVLPNYELHMLLAPHRRPVGPTTAGQRDGARSAAGEMPVHATMLASMGSVMNGSQAQDSRTARS